MKVITLISLLLLPFSAFAAIEGKKAITLDEVKKLEREIKKQEKEIKVFANDINKLEGMLSSKNQAYLKIQEKKEELLKNLDSIEATRKKIKQEAEKTKVQFQHIVKGMILVSLNQQEDSASLLERKILLQTINKIRTGQQQNLDELDREEKRLVEVSGNYQEQLDIEKELLAVLSNLEEEKKQTAQSYLEKVANNEALVLEYQKKRTEVILSKGQAKVKNDINVSFLTPIEEFSQIEHDKKGVTFHYKGRRELKAPRAGKVVYSGELASYGDVIMIDHGKDERSVLLGDFASKVKKGDDVRSQQIIAYTNESLNNSKVYFEVRKENKVQDTIHLIDKSSLTNEKQTVTQL